MRRRLKAFPSGDDQPLVTYRPFVDFYRENGISPVAQDISDLPRHLERRGSLYRLLGIPPTAVHDKTVIEFGPGSGHNAIATAAYRPRHYRFVDGNPTGMERLRGLLDRYAPGLDFRIDAHYIDEYAADERFDLVICEGVIPFQLDPIAFARHVASFAKPGGVVSLTTIDAASFLGDLARRLFADKLVPASVPPHERVRRLVPYFSADASSLVGMTRPLADYLYDNVVQPLPGKMFSVADALDALGDAFDVLGTSPDFTTDLRWFKRLHGAERDPNPRVRDAYRRNIVNLLDSRIEVAPHDPALGDEILREAATLYDLMRAFESGTHVEPHDLAAPVRAIAELVRTPAPSTATTLDAVAAALADPDLNAFPGEPVRSYFGRGMQYVSFVRRGFPSSTRP
jgi:hypothetical protein